MPSQASIFVAAGLDLSNGFLSRALVSSSINKAECLVIWVIAPS